eukprot:c22305_g1_i1.p1 GENE.c22305_g1_i1~~c22305_g1_i1.p1  ORF type:complete len:215 (+),score=86.94 c22305_g1_i1:28-645(+)
MFLDFVEQGILPGGGERKRIAPRVTKEMVLSFSAVGLCLILLFCGFRDCRLNSVSRILECDQHSCKFSAFEAGELKEEITIPKHEVVRGTLAHYEDGQAKLVPLEISASDRRKLTQMYIVEYRDSQGLPTNFFIMAKWHLGYIYSRKAVKKVNSFITGSTTSLYLSEGYSWTAKGVCFITIGFISLVCCYIFGEFNSNKREKKLG